MTVSYRVGFDTLELKEYSHVSIGNSDTLTLHNCKVVLNDRCFILDRFMVKIKVFKVHNNVVSRWSDYYPVHNQFITFYWGNQYCGGAIITDRVPVSA